MNTELHCFFKSWVMRYSGSFAVTGRTTWRDGRGKDLPTMTDSSAVYPISRNLPVLISRSSERSK